MAGFSPRLAAVAAVVVLTPAVAGCGYNTIPTKQERAEAAWADVQSQYQRRSDLVPNLVATVQASAIQERTTLTQVIEARAKATSVNIDASKLGDPAAFQQFQQAQGELGSALSRLLVVSENYPTLKSDQNFRDLQAQLEGTENRITVARGRYIQLVQDYNTYIRSFPQVITAKMFGYAAKPNFSVENEAQIAQPPTVDFGNRPAPQPQTPPPAPAPAQ